MRQAESCFLAGFPPPVQPQPGVGPGSAAAVWPFSCESCEALRLLNTALSPFGRLAALLSACYPFSDRTPLWAEPLSPCRCIWMLLMSWAPPCRLQPCLLKVRMVLELRVLAATASRSEMSTGPQGYVNGHWPGWNSPCCIDTTRSGGTRKAMSMQMALKDRNQWQRIRTLLLAGSDC